MVAGHCMRNEMIRLEDIAKDLGETFPHRKVCLELKDVPQNVALPRSWENFGLRPEMAPVFPDGWNSFSNEFPSTVALLNDCLLGTVLLLGDEVELAYIFHDGNGLYYYVGGTPIGSESTETFEFKHLPSRLQDFYREVHDGYTFFPARSMGPQHLGDQSRVSELADEADDSFAAGWITVFSNGGGDYVAVNADSHGDSDGLIWWHENPATPEFDIDVFRAMDAWMNTFLEDTKPREQLVGKPS
ncbi:MULTISPECIES: hypothetical protein [unclassified Stenotrophomonas]|uniref:hypothetical protein n=1 Tax=unclassified Stenotrophomonas TaxID=196198 RepID=UPI000D1707CF|nr:MULTISPECIES: hypothetical protein [unclassified Stenotrophomonas]PTA70126.1 hypothetical protein C9412_19165 [Stenotrophomonas sp. Nf1]PTA76255.1 hypothetical protein C9416_17725 [Stenotrophomonas sp. Nf4]